MTRKTFPTVFDHSGLGTMNVIPYVTLPGATLTMEIVKVSSAAVAGLTTVPLFSRNVFTGGGSSLKRVVAEIRYLLLFREFQIPYSANTS